MSLAGLGLSDIPRKLSNMAFGVKASLSQDRPSPLASPSTTTNPDGLKLIAGDQIFYRWQDENGVWQFTTERPPVHVLNYKPVITNSNANVIQSLDQEKISAALGYDKQGTPTYDGSSLKQQQEKTAELSEELESLGYDLTNPLKHVPKIIEQTKQIRATSEARQNALDQL